MATKKPIPVTLDPADIAMIEEAAKIQSRTRADFMRIACREKAVAVVEARCAEERDVPDKESLCAGDEKNENTESKT